MAKEIDYSLPKIDFTNDYVSDIKNILSLAKELNSQIGSVVSEAHLWNCRQFYLTFQNTQILSTLCRELSWSNYASRFRKRTKLLYSRSKKRLVVSA